MCYAVARLETFEWGVWVGGVRLELRVGRGGCLVLLLLMWEGCCAWSLGLVFAAAAAVVVGAVACVEDGVEQARTLMQVV